MGRGGSKRIQGSEPGGGVFRRKNEQVFLQEVRGAEKEPKTSFSPHSLALGMCISHSQDLARSLALKALSPVTHKSSNNIKQEGKQRFLSEEERSTAKLDMGPLYTAGALSFSLL